MSGRLTRRLQKNPDVIVVTISYRINVFGFFHLSHLSDGKDYPDAQNLGLLDQLKGLKWVHENIAAFGGDPDNVTIWGDCFRLSKARISISSVSSHKVALPPRREVRSKPSHVRTT